MQATTGLKNSVLEVSFPIPNYIFDNKLWLFRISHGQVKINREWRELTRKNQCNLCNLW